MSRFNIYGLIIIAAFMIPNIVYAMRNSDGFVNLWHNKAVEILEQIGRFGCFVLMIINIPHTWFGFWFDGALLTYIIVNFALTLIYCLIWIICFRKNSVFRAIALSAIPSAIFMFSGVMLLNIPLIIAAAIFAPCHIMISCFNTKLELEKDK